MCYKNDMFCTENIIFGARDLETTLDILGANPRFSEFSKKYALHVFFFLSLSAVMKIHLGVD